MDKDIVVESWCDLQEELFRGAWRSDIRRFRSPFVFRGLSDKDYRLETSLIRLGGPYKSLERHLLRNFRKYSQPVSSHLPSFWHLLTIAQHHGLPTRLLDWTYSPYIALHFATANHEKFDLDGVIWVVNFEKVHDLLPVQLKGCLQEEGAQAFTVELLSSLQPRNDGRTAKEDSSFHDVVRSLDQFDCLGEEKDFLLFFEPPSMDDRIVNQFALFSVMSNSGLAVDDWLFRQKGLYKRVILPKALKWEIRDKLDQSNITERVLFPGLDGLSSWLRRHYSPKG